MATSLYIGENLEKDIIILSLTGKLLNQNHEQLVQRITKHLAQRATRFIVDCGGLIVDNDQWIIGIARCIGKVNAKMGGRLVLANPSLSLKERLETKTPKLNWEIYETVADAVLSFDP